MEGTRTPLPVRPSGHTETRARAEAVLAKCEDSRVIENGRYHGVRVTIGDAEQLARDVLALIDQAAELRAAIAQIREDAFEMVAVGERGAYAAGRHAAATELLARLDPADGKAGQ